MTSPPNAVDGPDGRWYVFNEGTPQEERLRSVTAIVDVMDTELKTWAGGLAAKAAFDELPLLVAAQLTDDCGRTWLRCTHRDDGMPCDDCRRCEQCTPCMVRWMTYRHFAESSRRSDEGTRVHHMIYRWATTGEWPTPDPDTAPYLAAFQQLVADYGLEPKDWELLECTVVNRDLGYAGTLDGHVRIRRERSQKAADLLDRLTPDGHDRWDEALVLGDYKTREGEGRKLYPSVAVQLAGYRFAPLARLKDGSEHPLPVVDAAVVIQIRPDGADIYPIMAEEPELAVLVQLLQVDEWLRGRGKQAVSSRSFSFAPSVAKLRAADARARKKAELSVQHEEKPSVKPVKRGVKSVPGGRRARVLGAAHHGSADDIPF